jgi:hypothetical protein
MGLAITKFINNNEDSSSEEDDEYDYSEPSDSDQDVDEDQVSSNEQVNSEEENEDEVEDQNEEVADENEDENNQDLPYNPSDIVKESIDEVKEQAVQYCLKNNSTPSSIYLISLNGVNVGYRLTVRSAHRAVNKIQRIILENKPLLPCQYKWSTYNHCFRYKKHLENMPILKQFVKTIPKFQHFTLTSISNNNLISYPRVEDVITIERISHVC